MDENYSLEHREIKAGFTLSCQARPNTEKLALDLDAQEGVSIGGRKLSAGPYRGIFGP